jgi:hypothetical protein
MKFFSKFPKVNADVRGDGTYQQLVDITRRVRFREQAKLDLAEYDFYDVKDGETPEYVANVYYGDPEYHWVVLLANDIHDYYRDWPQSQAEFEECIRERYDNVDDIHHYEIYQDSGDTTEVIMIPTESQSLYPNAIAITNFEYEESLREKRRRIRLINPTYLEQIEKEFEALIIQGSI